MGFLSVLNARIGRFLFVCILVPTLLLSYLVALQYATKSLGQVSKLVTLTSRYLPQIKRYWDFVSQEPEAGGRAPMRATDADSPASEAPQAMLP